MYIEPLVPHIVDFGIDSTLIARLEYFEEIKELDIYFNEKYYIKQATYENIEMDFFLAFTEAKSKGRFYLTYIKPFLFTKQKTSTMAKQVVKVKIDVTKINKDYLYTGASGVYLNFTILLDQEEDQYKNNGMVIQDVPTEIYKAEKAKNMTKSEMTKGAILGNCKIFGDSGGNRETAPGVESGTRGVSPLLDDDLPF